MIVGRLHKLSPVPASQTWESLTLSVQFERRNLLQQMHYWLGWVLSLSDVGAYPSG
jgi:hypothetical protein